MLTFIFNSVINIIYLRTFTHFFIVIDTISVLVTQLESKLDEFEQRDLKGLISDLQINFVQQSAKGP